MLTLLFRKMRNTKWMVLCLLIGFIMASAMMSTIPIYMNASLQRMLVKDMEDYQLENEEYPGAYNVKFTIRTGLSTERQKEEIGKISSLADKQYAELGCPAAAEKDVLSDEYVAMASQDKDVTASRFILAGITNMADHVTMKSGRMFQSGLREDGVMEVIATEKTMKLTQLAPNTVYTIANSFDRTKTMKIEIVGVFDSASETDPYWAEGLDTEYTNHLFADYGTYYDKGMESGALNPNLYIKRIAIDYQKLDMNDVDSLIALITNHQNEFKKAKAEFVMPISVILQNYGDRADRLKLILWLVQIPVIMMILVYLFMVSQLNVEQERNEIAVFKSRGASRLQVMAIYALESLILGGITAVTGPFIGMLLCKVLGASNGFLEFVNRKSLPISMTAEAFLYAGVAVAVFFLTTMIPIIPATKATIVEHKQSKAKKKKFALWEKLGIDFILAGGAVAWLYYYNNQQDKLIKDGMTDTTATVNPLMFIASTAFILGLGLFFIRVYPMLIRLLTRAGKRIWSPAAHVSLNNIGRCANGRERFLMIFLILTVSLGIFFANTARALNRSAEERVSYAVGADVTLTEKWSSSKVVKSSQSQSGMPQNAAAAPAASDDEDTSQYDYTEPDFEKFNTLTGVKKATKVFIKNGVTISSEKMNVPPSAAQQAKIAEAANRWGGWRRNNAQNSFNANETNRVKLMTVNPAEFSQVCWSADRLLPAHINTYLNALAEYNAGVILSASFRDKYGLALGDKVMCKWGRNEAFEVTILAFVDYWPSINPYEKTEDDSYIDFAVMNYDYVHVLTNAEPYQVWLDLEDNATTEALYDSISEKGIKPTMLNVKNQKIISEKTDPMLQGMNGALTLGFIIIMIMCIIGFLIYWILSIKSRTLQFGILRAMGMSYGEIIAMIVYEQLLTSGAAIFTAIFVGGIASELYVPLFQSLYSVSERVPGFAVIPLRSDYIKLYLVILAMLLVGFIVLGRLISKIKISQALKLGED